MVNSQHFSSADLLQEAAAQRVRCHQASRSRRGLQRDAQQIGADGPQLADEAAAAAEDVGHRVHVREDHLRKFRGCQRVSLVSKSGGSLKAKLSM